MLIHCFLRIQTIWCISLGTFHVCQNQGLTPQLPEVIKVKIHKSSTYYQQTGHENTQTHQVEVILIQYQILAPNL